MYACKFVRVGVGMGVGGWVCKCVEGGGVVNMHVHACSYSQMHEMGNVTLFNIQGN